MKNISIKKQFIFIIGLAFLVQLIILVTFLLFSQYQYYKDSTKLAYRQEIKTNKDKVRREVEQLHSIIGYEIKKNKQEVKRKTRRRVYEAYDIAWSIFNRYKNEKSLHEIKNMIITALRDIRFFNGRGYYFIDSLEGEVIMYPVRPSQEGESYLNLTDVEGKPVVQAFIDTVKNNYEGYVKYKTFIPENRSVSSKASYNKISFVKFFEPFNWIIGTGDYAYGNIKELKENVINIIDSKRYGENGYFFAYNYSGECLNLPPDRDKEQINMIDYTNSKGTPVIKKALEIAKNGGGFMTWYYKSLSDNKSIKKIGYIQGIDELGMFYGTGVYVDEISSSFKKLQEEYKNITFSNSLVILFTLLIAYGVIYLLTRNLAKRLGKDIDMVADAFDVSLKDDRLIPENITRMSELSSLIKSFNTTLGEKHLFNRIAKEKERQFTSLFEKSAEPMLIINKDGIVDCNLSAVEFLGYKLKREILKHPAFISPEKQPYGRNSFESYNEIIDEIYRKKGSKKFEWVHLKSDGMPVHTSTVLAFIEPQNFILCTWRDITKRVEAERALAYEKNKLSAMLQSIKDAVVIVDLDCNVVYTNNAFTKITGLSGDEALGKNFDNLLSFYELNSGKAEIFSTKNVLHSGKSYSNLNGLKIIDKQGVERIVSKVITPIRQDGERLTGVVVVLRDVTDNVIFQQKKSKFASLQSIAVFTGSMAHEFNNILTGILTNTYLAKQHCHNERAAEFITKIEQSVFQATKTTNNLLQYTQTGTLRKNTANIYEIVKDISDVVFSDSRITVNIDKSTELWDVDIDKVKISQVFNSIFLNAKQSVKDSAAGRVDVKISNVFMNKSNGYDLKEGKYLCVDITDNGTGVPRDIREKIFEPYFTTRKNNNGVGLFHARNIVVNHGGKMILSSEKNKGSTFSVFLPAFDDYFLSAGDMKPSDRDSSLRFMIVDDNVYDRESLKNVLEFLGYSVMSVAGYSEASKLIRAGECYEFIIAALCSDNGMNFEDFLYSEKPFLEGSTVIIAVEKPEEDYIQSVKNDEKIAALIHKPFKMGELERIIKTVKQ
ncbi:MAG: PAS domain S-box protein [Flexistipes sinusarabici]|uniref:histidine kinase n=1 Tax=Flexistipes sinusarabici TaxID=2352 RepID=A0A5D0MN26_FLESI|nr:cache domain-containing protein [Flexistipes sinusarabici]TYB33802.1 MAG: PAS domain S-box protein [Flexistipes sinusarabici]